MIPYRGTSLTLYNSRNYFLSSYSLSLFLSLSLTSSLSFPPSLSLPLFSPNLNPKPSLSRPGQVCLTASPFELVTWRNLAPRRAAAALSVVAGWPAAAMAMRAAAEAANREA